VLGLAQQVRGAHYMSHTLWSAWACWVAGLLVEEAVQAWRRAPAMADTKLNGT
jgi:membrane-associated PAP2 superfamily phosphatase